MKKPLSKIVLGLVTILSIFISSFAAPKSAQAGPINDLIDQINIAETICDGNSIAAGLPVLNNAFSQYVTAERAWYDQSLCQFSTKVLNKDNPDEIFGERYTYAQLNWITNSLFTSFIQGINNLIIAVLKSYVPAAANNNAIPQNRISFIYQVNEVLGKFNLAAPVSAQGGFGFETSRGLQELWGASRNMALLFMVVALLAAGFMVMFRIKINPQTAVSIQLLIPRLIIALIGIVFSYAIAGLIIDLIYVIISVVIYMAPGSLFTNPSNRQAAISFFTQADFFGLLIYLMAGIAPIIIIFGFTMPPLAIIIGILYFLLIGKVFWKLLSAYFMFVLQIIIGPWQILLGVIPAAKGGYVGGLGSWFRTTLGHASVFVLMPLLLFLNQIFWNYGGGMLNLTTLLNVMGEATSTLNGTPLSPQIIGIVVTEFPRMPLMAPGGGGITGVLFGFFMGLAALAIAPKLADSLREKITGSKGAGYESAVGEVIGASAGMFSQLQKNRRDAGLPPIPMTTKLVDDAKNTVTRGMRGVSRDEPVRPGG